MREVAEWIHRKPAQPLARDIPQLGRPYPGFALYTAQPAFRIFRLPLTANGLQLSPTLGTVGAIKRGNNTRMDIARPNVAKEKRRKRIIYAVIAGVSL